MRDHKHVHKQKHKQEQQARRLRFPLSSDDCELLAAFEDAASLTDLAKRMHKDPSVVSRGLQAIAQSGVLEKSGNRWVLTALGRQINRWTRTATASQAKIFAQQARTRLLNANLPAVTSDTALLLIGVQNGFDDPIWGLRNNPQAEERMTSLLTAWRIAQRPVYHIIHLSEEPASPLKFGTLGATAKACAQPAPTEVQITKSANSAFRGTKLATLLRQQGHRSLVIAGFSTNHCIDATARAAGDLGFRVFVVADACVAFDRVGLDGSVVKADDTHRAVMANLNQEFATVIESSDILAREGEDAGILA